MTYIAKNLPAQKHCFFGALGGVSGGKYASLNANLSSRDNPDNVAKNLTLVAQKFGLSVDNMFLPYLKSDNKAVFANTPSIKKIEADGCVTNQKDLLLCIRTADCVPIFFYDKKASLVGASHAGWRGALTGVIQNTINLMIEHGSHKENIQTAVGPCLQQKSFEVQDDLYQKFLAQSLDNKKFFISKDQGFLFDLQGYVVEVLHNLGLENISVSDIDTYTNLDYFSFRRNTHQKLISAIGDYPTQFSVITL